MEVKEDATNCKAFPITLECSLPPVMLNQRQGCVHLWYKWFSRFFAFFLTFLYVQGTTFYNVVWLLVNFDFGYQIFGHVWNVTLLPSDPLQGQLN